MTDTGITAKSLRVVVVAYFLLHAVQAQYFTECGGELTGQAGVITSPNFPDGYPDNSRCDWTITVAENQIIDLRFQTLNLEQRCRDYLDIHDGPSTSYTRLERLCYKDPTQLSSIRIRSTGHQLHLHFSSNNEISLPGFSANYWAHECPPFTYGDPDCTNTCQCNQTNTRFCDNLSGYCNCTVGWTSDDCSVDINECARDPNACPKLYTECANTQGSFDCICKAGLNKTDTGDCTGVEGCKTCSHICGIKSDNPGVEICYCPEGMKLDPSNNTSCIECEDWSFGENCAQTCRCIQGHTESCDKRNGLCSCSLAWQSTNCEYDANECRLENPPCNTTTSRCYNTHGSFECRCYRGFEKVGSDINECHECGRVLTGPSGSIVSRIKYNRNYAFYDEVCSWNVRGGPDDVVSLRFQKFDLYQNLGYVEIYDGKNSSAQLIQRFYADGTGSPPVGIIRSSGNEMHIVRFGLGQRFRRKGFTASYWTHECPEHRYDENCTTPCHCNWPNTKLCNSTNGDCICQQGWTAGDCSCDIDECYENPLNCPDYSNCKNLNGSFECECKEGLVNTSGQCAAAESGDVCTQRSCSHVCVKSAMSLQDEVCYCPIGMELDGDQCIDCKNNRYGPDCYRQCKCVTSNTDECDTRTGHCTCLNGWTGKLCNEDVNECDQAISPCPDYSTCLNTDGSFSCECIHSDGYENSNNNEECVRIDCSHTLNNETGNITSPDYPASYFNNARCSWTISVKRNNVVSLRFSSFYTESCCDILEVYDGCYEGSQMIGRYSGTFSSVIRTTGSCLYARFTSDRSIQHRGFSGAYTSHSCPEFTYGDVTCDKNCSCVQANSQYCNNINGQCICKPGWMGGDCSQDINECMATNANVCPDNSDCVNTNGSHRCDCHRGFVYNSTTHLCDVHNTCVIKQCSHTCYIDQYKEICACPDGLVLDQVRGLTCVIPYYPYGSEARDATLSSEGDNMIFALVSKPIEISSRVPFGTTVQDVVFVFTNGIFKFDTGFVPQTPDLSWASANNKAIVAPLWAQTNMNSGETYYHLYEKCPESLFVSPDTVILAPESGIVMKRAKEDIIKFYQLQDFEVNVALVVTWEAVAPVNSLPGELNTFQGLYISGWQKEIKDGREVLSDEQTAYVIFLYQQGLMNWLDMPGRILSIGVPGNSVLDGGGTSVIQMLDTYPGRPGYKGLLTFEVGRAAGQEQMCHRYVCNNADLLSDPVYKYEIEQLYQCPCTLERLGHQWQLYSKSGDKNEIYCYAISAVAKRRFLSGNKRNKLCCYKWNKPDSEDWEEWERTRRNASYIYKMGHVLARDPWSLYYSDNFEFRENMEANKWCCGSSSKPELCMRFNKIFPDMGCTNFVQFITASALGDPHITTLDGLTYTMNGWGEYVMLNVPSENFTLQARTSRALSSDGTVTNATVFTAFAAKEFDNASVQFELASTNTSMVITSNGEDLTNAFYKDFDFEKATSDIRVFREFRNNRTMAIATFPCGVTIKVHVALKSLQIELEVEKSLQNKTQGLLGYFNGKVSDDFTLPNGTVLAANISERNLFKQFAKSWEVSPKDSVFTYWNGESATDYQHPDFVPMFKDEAKPHELDEAKKVCGNKSDACIFDYLVTKDHLFAETTKRFKAEQESVANILKNIPPVLSVRNGSLNSNNHLVVKYGTRTQVQFDAADEDNDPIEYNVLENSDAAVIDENGLLVFTPTMAHNSDVISVQVMDSKGSFSPVVSIQMVICPSCNGHGECSPTKLRDTTAPDSPYQLLICNCYPAYTGEDCEKELDACESKPCIKGQICIDLTAEEQGHNTTGYKCGPCPTGYQEVDGICIDIDECSNATKHCSQLCTNTDGSYNCRCFEGYRLDFNDQKTCGDIDECADKTSKCQQRCINHPGNYSCDCEDGYALKDDGLTCIAELSNEDECSSLNCEQTCLVMEDGDPECTCYDGFERNLNDTTSCIDIDECQAENKPCSQDCTNTVGDFVCSCYVGYELNDDGVSCSFCQNPYYGEDCASVCQCNGHGTCDPLRGCLCESSWTGSHCEEDVNECLQEDACPAGQVCKNEMGSYSCSCQDGYQKVSGNCEDIDECTSLQVAATCDLLVETCQNTIGSYTCVCLPGFSRSDGKCEDIDECAMQTDACEQDCENVPGSYNCKCPRGSRLGPDRHSCLSGRELCLSVNLTCSHDCAVDDNDNPYCTCPRGYQLNGTEICEDIDECADDDKNRCAYKEGCTNTEGNYKCSCPAGSKLDNNGRFCLNCTGETWGVECANACECGFGTDHCDLKTGCVCKQGFTGKYCSQDIDECQSGQLTCKPKEECVNTRGSALCRCQQGYTLENGICVDFDECQDIHTNDCLQKCENTEGGYTCSCFPGYTWNSTAKTCIDIDECSLQSSKCKQICINTEGSYRCSCESGLLLQPDRISCDSTLPCPSNNTCSDQCVMMNETLAVCQCPKGKTLSPTNKSLCIDVDLCDHSLCSFGCLEIKGNTSFACVCDVGQKLAADGFTCTDCIDGSWGVDCAYQCLCEASNTKLCDKVDGTCACKTGWTGANCFDDIDECTQSPSPCDGMLHTSCINNDGGYVCACSDGYFKSSSAGNTCEECDSNHYGPSCQSSCTCGPHEVCDKVDGSCSCSQYWEGSDCNTDVDECERGLYQCNETNLEECSNTPGSYNCVCQRGYERDCPTCECKDINECSDETTHNCAQVCINVDGDFKCSCHPGYSYSEEDNSCIDVDECEMDPKVCAQNCSNTVGSFKCSCLPGFVVNGTSCITISTREVITTFDFNASQKNLTTGSDDFKDLAVLIGDLMKKSLAKTGLAVLSVTVTSLRKGSLIAVIQVEVNADEVYDPGEVLAQSLIAIRNLMSFTVNNQTSSLLKLTYESIEILPTDSVCEIKKRRQPCPEKYYCEEEGDVAVCKSQENKDRHNLILGLGIGLPLFIMLITAIGIGTYCWTKRQSKDTHLGQESTDRPMRGMENVYTDGHYRRKTYRDNSMEFSRRSTRMGSSTVNSGYGEYDDLFSQSHRSTSWMDSVLKNQSAGGSVLGQRVVISNAGENKLPDYEELPDNTYVNEPNADY